MVPSPGSVSGIPKVRSCLAMVYHSWGSASDFISSANFTSLIPPQKEPKLNQPVTFPPQDLSKKNVGINRIPKIAPRNRLKNHPMIGPSIARILLVEGFVGHNTN